MDDAPSRGRRDACAARLLFLACGTLGAGTVPRLPAELRRAIDDLARPAPAAALRLVACRTCPRVLCVAVVRSAASYESLLAAERTCLECFSSARPRAA